MACSSSSSLVLTAINATLEDRSFRTGSEVAADAPKVSTDFKKTGTGVKRIKLFWPIFLPSASPTPSPRTEFSMSQFKLVRPTSLTSVTIV